MTETGGSSVAVGIHWLTFSTHQPIDSVLETVSGEFGPLEAQGGFNQPKRFVHESGASVFWGSKDPEQPIVVNVPGEACDVAAELFVRQAAWLGARVTRLDVAADLNPPEGARARLMQLRRSWLRGQVATRMRRSSHRLLRDHSEQGGVTCYFGRPGSRLQLRAYDRRGPLRLEWEYRPERDVGLTVPDAVIKRGVPAVWRTLAMNAVWPMPWYRQLLVGDTISWTRTIAAESEFLRTLQAFRVQWGVQLWALLQLGLRVDELAVRPENPRPEVVTKLLRWSVQAEGEGYDGEALRRELRQWVKLKCEPG